MSAGVIRLQHITERLVLNTLLDTGHLHLATPSEQTTPHPLGCDWSKVATPAVIASHGETLLPLLTLDLAALGTGLTGRIPVLYHELVFIDCVVCQLDAEGLITDISFLGSDGPIDMKEQLDGEEAFEEGVEEAIANLQDLETRFLKVQPGPKLPSLSEKDVERYEELSEQELPDSEHEEDDYAAFGPFPVQVQSTLSVPSDPTGVQMPFVGQVSTSNFGMVDIRHFLFYDPVRRVVAQVLQMT